MHVVVANVSVIYAGRGESTLPAYDRVIMLKQDGTVSVHGDRGYKPMNYMATSAKFEEHLDGQGQRVWVFSTSKERLTITFHRIYQEYSLALGDEDPGHSTKTGTERQLQEWLAENLALLDPSLTFMEREHRTGAGAVDLLASDLDGNLVAIEVKRLASMTAVGQTLRYVKALRERESAAERPKGVRGCIIAIEFKAKTLELASKDDLQCLLVPKQWREGSDQIAIPTALSPGVTQ